MMSDKTTWNAEPTPFEIGYKHGLTGADPRSNPCSDRKDYNEWGRGHNCGIEIWRLNNPIKENE